MLAPRFVTSPNIDFSHTIHVQSSTILQMQKHIHIFKAQCINTTEKGQKIRNTPSLPAKLFPSESDFILFIHSIWC